MLERAARFLMRHAVNRPYRPKLGIWHVWDQVMRPAGTDTRIRFLASGSRSTEEIERRLVRCFRARGRPAFFCTADELSAAIVRVRREHPEWVNRTLSRVKADVEEGLDIYGSRGPRLDGRFPWGSLEHGHGDHLYALRPHRFAFAPQMALAAVYDETYGEAFAALLASWSDFATRNACGMAYPTKLVVTQRFLALGWAWAFLASRPAEHLNAKDYRLESHVLRILHADAQFLLKRIGGEFPNNHLLADWFVGWYIATLFPELISPTLPFRDYQGEWLRQVEQQIYEDGTSFEHSVHYHEFASELVVAYLLISIRNRRVVPAWLIEQARRMLRFQVDMQAFDSTPLALGDTTEDPIFPLDVSRTWAGVAMRELYRALFDPDMPAAKHSDPTVERAFWILGGDLDGDSVRATLAEWNRGALERTDEPESARCATGSLRCYPDGGFYQFQDGDQRLLLRTGPAPGSRLCAGHMHADLLSVYLSIGGTPAVVEAGTYTYVVVDSDDGPEPSWRRYLLGPAAHNGLSIEDEDPLGSVTGAFRSPDVPARVEVPNRFASDWLSWVEGRISSDNVYGGFKRGVVSILGEYWFIYDIFPSQIERRSAWVGFQLAKEAKIKASTANRTEVDIGFESFSISASPGRPEILRGDLDPVGGWISSQYGSIAPAIQLRFRPRGPCAGYLIAGNRGGDQVWRVDEAVVTDQGAGFQLGAGRLIDYVLIPHSKATQSGQMELWGIRFAGSLLWLRIAGREPAEMRAVQCRRLEYAETGIDLRLHHTQELLVIRHGAKGPEVSAGDVPWDRESRWGARPIGG